MAPDLMEEGARRLALHPGETAGKTEFGGRAAGFGRPLVPGEVDTAHGRILYLEDVSVSFDGFRAINKLSLDIAPGELRCIIGPNGAGKTTMMDIITGKTRPDSGTVYFGSTIDLLRYKEPQIAQMGIGRKFQKSTVFEQLTVYENLELADDYVVMGGEWWWRAAWARTGKRRESASWWPSESSRRLLPTVIADAAYCRTGCCRSSAAGVAL